MKSLKDKKGFICDMDGVIYHGNKLLDGVKEFVDWLAENGKSYLFLTNSSERSPRELSQKLERLGLSVTEDHFYTSAMATASFLRSQNPNGSAYVIGEAGLINAIYGAGFSMNDVDPDYSCKYPCPLTCIGGNWDLASRRLSEKDSSIPKMSAD